jgi:hypothetical protein
MVSVGFIFDNNFVPSNIGVYDAVKSFETNLATFENFVIRSINPTSNNDYSSADGGISGDSDGVILGEFRGLNVDGTEV